MRTLGIEIDNNKAIFYALEKDVKGNLNNLIGSFKYLLLEKDNESDRVKDFQLTVFSFLKSLNPDKIAILTRQSSGKFQSSPISFKIEGLIQCYNPLKVELVSPRTLIAYYKTNPIILNTDFKYQNSAFKLANFLL